MECDCSVAPNGIMYVKETVRKGLLARMLIELLDTRVMVKQAMKGTKDDKVFTRGCLPITTVAHDSLRPFVGFSTPASSV